MYLNYHHVLSEYKTPDLYPNTHTHRARKHTKSKAPQCFFNKSPFPFIGAVKHEFPVCPGPSICPWGPLWLCSDGLWPASKGVDSNHMHLKPAAAARSISAVNVELV